MIPQKEKINERFDLKIVSQTKSPTDNGYGSIDTSVYECPCGKGNVILTEENIPGYYDFYTSFNCSECKEKYELLWGMGVSPGHSPMIRKKL